MHLHDLLNTIPKLTTQPSGFWQWIAELIRTKKRMALAIAPRSRPKSPVITQEDIAERTAIKGLRPFERKDAVIFSQLQRSQNLRDCLESMTSRSFRFGILMGESGCGKTSFLQAGIWPQLTREDTDYVGIYVRFSDQEPIRTIAGAIAEQLEIPLDCLLEPKAAHALTQRSSITSEPTPSGSLASVGFHTSTQPTRSTRSPSPFLTLLTQVMQKREKPLILLFDQFEQFFVHHKREADRQPFIRDLQAWYKAAEPLPVRILVSIRSDLVYHLDELHQALGYRLGPSEVVQLKKFTANQAARVLGVIARAEHLTFDRKLVAELAEQELANREDGLIFPVDMQILVWMIERQTAEELRAFNQRAFQKFGGVEGLLQRFLVRTLETRVMKRQREAAVKVLLALTDLDRQVRAGVLTVTMLKSKLRGTVPSGDVEEAVEWLARGDVRLITPQEPNSAEGGGQETGYELAHEQLIPALMRQAGKELSAADRANQLLDRRVNEWLGNGRQSRYWFGPGELWQIERQWPYLAWGAKRPQKERLLRLSRIRVYSSGLALSIATVALATFYPWLSFAAGHMHRVQGQLQQTLVRAAPNIATEVAIAYTNNEEWAEALSQTQRDSLKLDGGAQKIEPIAQQDLALAGFIRSTSGWLHDDEVTGDPTLLVQKLSGLATSATPPTFIANALRDEPQAAAMLAAMLDEASTAARDITSDRAKSHALRSIAIAYWVLRDKPQAAAVLEEASIAARDIPPDEDKSHTLSAIADVYRMWRDVSRASAMLEEAIAAARDISSDGAKSSALRAIAAASGELSDAPRAAGMLEEAITVARDITSDKDKSKTLRVIAAAYRALGNAPQAAAVLEEAITAARDISDDRAKSNALRMIATAYGRLSDAPRAAEVLEEAITAARDIPSNRSKSDALHMIATAYGQLSDTPRAAEVLEEAITVARDIPSDGSKAHVLRSIATASGQLSDASRAAEVLEEAITAARDITADGTKSKALSAIAAASGQLGDAPRAAAVLEETISVARDIPSDGAKFYVLRAISGAYRALGDAPRAGVVFEEAITTIGDITDDRDKSNALSAIAAASGELSDVSRAAVVLEEAITATRDITSGWAKSNALSAIAAASGELSDVSRAAAVLEEAITAARDITNGRSKSDALRAIAVASGELSDAPRAAEVLEEAITAAQDITDDWAKSDALQAIAAAYGALNDTSRAAEVLEEAITAARDITVDEAKFHPLSTIAAAYGDLSDTSRAAEVLEEAITTARDIISSEAKFYALRAIAAASGELSDASRAAEVLEEVTTAARDVTSDKAEFYVLSSIFDAYWALGDAPRATAVFEEAIATVRDIPDDWEKYQALSSIASRVIALSSDERVSVVFSGVDGQLAKIEGTSGHYTGI